MTLLDHAATAARAAGLDALWLAVVPGNARARRFYERCGWVDDSPLDHVVHVGGTDVHVPARRYVLALAER